MLLKKELGLTLKSLTYWLVVLFIGGFLFTQLGSDFISLKQPEPGKNDYGIARTTNKKDIQQQTIFSLLQQYNSKGFNTYPFGFLKTVTPSKSDKATSDWKVSRGIKSSPIESGHRKSANRSICFGRKICTSKRLYLSCLRKGYAQSRRADW